MTISDLQRVKGTLGEIIGVEADGAQLYTILDATTDPKIYQVLAHHFNALMLMRCPCLYVGAVALDPSKLCGDGESAWSTVEDVAQLVTCSLLTQSHQCSPAHSLWRSAQLSLCPRFTSAGSTAAEHIDDNQIHNKTTIVDSSATLSSNLCSSDRVQCIFSGL